MPFLETGFHFPLRKLAFIAQRFFCLVVSEWDALRESASPTMGGIRETLAVANAGEWLVRLVAGLGVRPGGKRGMIKQALAGMETEQCGTVWWGGLG